MAIHIWTDVQRSIYIVTAASGLGPKNQGQPLNPLLNITYSVFKSLMKPSIRSFSSLSTVGMFDMVLKWEKWWFRVIQYSRQVQHLRCCATVRIPPATPTSRYRFQGCSQGGFQVAQTPLQKMQIFHNGGGGGAHTLPNPPPGGILSCLEPPTITLLCLHQWALHRGNTN